MIRSGAPPRVLIVDDSEDQIRLLTHVLKADGYHCLPARNGVEAMAACTPGQVDIMLLDVQMPELDGVTTCRALKANPETCLIPVLMMTGGSDRESYIQALEAGADDFLHKPIAIPELRARVRSACRMKAYIDDLDNAAAAVVMLGATIEARDPYTNGHCHRLADYACALGKRVGLDRLDLHALQQGGYLHDLGKIAVPDAVLLKTGPLTREEYALVKSHPIAGDRILAPLRTLERARLIVRSHHETLDGSGYPDGLRGSAVPLLAQVTAIADVFDALTSDRPYRRALSAAAALEILYDEAASGKRDVALVNEFAALVDVTAPVSPSKPAYQLAPAQPAA
jgi:putative two-component system response regulator